MLKSFNYSGHTVFQEGENFVSQSVGEDFPLEMEAKSLRQLLSAIDQVDATADKPETCPAWLQDWLDGIQQGRIQLSAAINLDKLFNLDAIGAAVQTLVDAGDNA